MVVGEVEGLQVDEQNTRRPISPPLCNFISLHTDWTGQRQKLHVLNLGERTLVPGKKNGPHDFGFGGQALGGVDESRFGAADYMARAFAMKFWRLCAFWTFWWGKKSVPRLPAKIVAQG